MRKRCWRNTMYVEWQPTGIKIHLAPTDFMNAQTVVGCALLLLSPLRALLGNIHMPLPELYIESLSMANRNEHILFSFGLYIILVLINGGIIVSWERTKPNEHMRLLVCVHSDVWRYVIWIWQDGHNRYYYSQRVSCRFLEWILDFQNRDTFLGQNVRISFVSTFI